MKMVEPVVNTTEELTQVLNLITFVNTVLDFKWKFELKAVEILTCGEGSTRDAWLLWVTFERPDTITGIVGRGKGREEIIWQGTTLSGVVKTAWLLVELLVRHELMEGFRFDNTRIFNPHNSVLDLVDLQLKHDNKDTI